MRSRSARAAALGAALACAQPALAQRPAAPRATAADSAALARAFTLESEDKPREAAALYRSVLKPGTASPALLGLERVYDALGWADSLVGVADAAVRAEPRDPTLRTVHLRALRAAGRAGEMRGAFERWMVAVPRDPAPFREYARILLETQETAAAEAVLELAAIRLGGTTQLALEVAQLKAASGLWDAAAAAWRAAVDEQDYLAEAAAASLGRAPVGARDSLRARLAAPRPTLGARRALAALELGWGSPTRAWQALGGLPPNEKTLAAWADFGERAEAAGAWGAARSAFAAVEAVRPSAETAARAASAAVEAGDAAGALSLVARAESRAGAAGAPALAALRVRALVAGGRLEEAERVAQSAGATPDPEARGRMMQSVAWGWVRAGDVARARRALAAAGGADGVETIEGWLALYAGDLRTARTLFRVTSDASTALVDALALLSRTAVDSSAAAGAAHLALARGDTAGAAAAFAAAASTVPGATPLMLATPRACTPRPGRRPAPWRSGRPSSRSTPRRPKRPRPTSSGRAPSGAPGRRRPPPSGWSTSSSHTRRARSSPRLGASATASSMTANPLVRPLRARPRLRARLARLAGALLCVALPRLAAAQWLLVPMDDEQRNHLKAYGLTFNALKAGLKAEWLLNYRGGAFLLPDTPTLRRIAALGGVSASPETDGAVSAIRAEIAGGNMDVVVLDKAPKVAVYTPPNAPPYDDAVTLALEYAGIGYDKIYDAEVLGGGLGKYDWLHLHHEDFTGQLSKFYLAYRAAPWFIQQLSEGREMARRNGFETIPELKKAVADRMRGFVENGGFLFAMCGATETLELAIAGRNVDIAGAFGDGSPVDPNADERMNWGRAFAFAGARVEQAPFINSMSDIDGHQVNVPGRRQPLGSFSLFSFSAKFDPVASMLVQDHRS
jgi:hypothetical protein